MVSPLPYLKKTCLSLMVSLLQNQEHRLLVFSHPRASKQEMEQPPCRALPRVQSHHTQNLSPPASEPALTAQCTKGLGFLPKHHDLGGSESHANHPVDLLLHIHLTSSSPTTGIAALRAYSCGCSVVLSSQKDCTSDISEQKIPVCGGRKSPFPKCLLSCCAFTCSASTSPHSLAPVGVSPVTSSAPACACSQAFLQHVRVTTSPSLSLDDPTRLLSLVPLLFHGSRSYSMGPARGKFNCVLMGLCGF